MKRVILIGLMNVFSLQLLLSEPPHAIIVPSEFSKNPKIPSYRVYEHFLGWVNALNKHALEVGMTDPYKFAEPFAPDAGLANSDLDVVRKEAKSLDTDLRRQDAKAAVVISGFRAKAKKAAQLGQPLPPAPAEVRQLQQQRTALLVQHVVTLRRGLGPDTSSMLDRYLAHDFLPHISFKKIHRPEPVTGTTDGKPSFAVNP